MKKIIARSLAVAVVILLLMCGSEILLNELPNSSLIERKNAFAESSAGQLSNKEGINSWFVPNKTKWSKLKEQYTEQVYASEDSETFLFYTDPHIPGSENWEDRYKNVLSYITWVYDWVPVNFCICGGDFLTNVAPYNEEITADEAVFYLQYTDRLNREAFGANYFLAAVGNHDLNYQGTEEISSPMIAEAMFPDKGKTYYRYEGTTSDIYVLDTGRNWIVNEEGKADYDVPMDEYKWEQINWLAEQLEEHDAAHNIIVMHIILNSNDENDVRFCLYDNAYQLCQAYNRRKKIILNNIDYDFSNCSGKVEFFLGGHIHRDRVSNDMYSIPFIIRRKLITQNKLAFDCVLCDWKNRIVQFTRFGEGKSVTVQLP